jgi:ABC-type transport system involved in multi-copper enzyme maturation permease subunit
MLVLAAFLTPYYIGMDFKTRVWNNALYTGRSRTAVFFSRLLAYYVIVAILSLLTSLGLIAMFSGTIFIRAALGYILVTLLKRLLVDLMIMTVPVLFIFLFKGAIFPSVSTLIVNLGAWFAINKIWGPIMEVPLRMESQSVSPLRPEQLPQLSLYSVSLWITAAVLVLCIVSAWVRFLRCDLE